MRKGALARLLSDEHELSGLEQRVYEDHGTSAPNPL